MEHKTALEVTNIVTDYINNFSSKEKDFCLAMSFQHRTLQQNFTRLALEWLETVASANYLTDGRNADSQTVARKLLDNSPEFYGEPSKALRTI